MGCGCDHTEKDTTLKVSGMTCGGCSTSVESALKSVEGVTGACVDLDAGSVKISHSGADGIETSLLKAVKEAGFEAAVA